MGSTGSEKKARRGTTADHACAQDRGADKRAAAKAKRSGNWEQAILGAQAAGQVLEPRPDVPGGGGSFWCLPRYPKKLPEAALSKGAHVWLPR